MLKLSSKLCRNILEKSERPTSTWVGLSTQISKVVLDAVDQVGGQYADKAAIEHDRTTVEVHWQQRTDPVTSEVLSFPGCTGMTVDALHLNGDTFRRTVFAACGIPDTEENAPIFEQIIEELDAWLSNPKTVSFPWGRLEKSSAGLMVCLKPAQWTHRVEDCDACAALVLQQADSASPSTGLRQAEALLQRLTELLPPPPNCKHALLLHNGQLGVNIMQATTCQVIGFEEADFDKDLEALAQEIVAVTSRFETSVLPTPAP